MEVMVVEVMVVEVVVVVCRKARREVAKAAESAYLPHPEEPVLHDKARRGCSRN